MNVRSFEIQPSGGLAPLGIDEVARRREENAAAFWVDVEGSSGEDGAASIAGVFRELGLEEMSAERFRYIGRVTHVIPTPQEALIEVAAFADRDCTRQTSLGFVCKPGLVVSFHAEPIQRFSEAMERGPDLRLRAASPTGLVLSAFTVLAEDLAGALRELRADLIALDEAMDRSPGSVSLDDILDRKDTLLRLASVAEEQAECFDTFDDADTEALDLDGLRSAVLMLQAVAGSSDRRAERLDKRVGDLRHRFELGQQEKTNHRLAMLTVLSAVFLPLTLMAGIWGMNFEGMPELGLRFGYPAALGLMAFVGLGLTALFYRRGWFG